MSPMSVMSTMDETSNLETYSGPAVLKEFLIFRVDTLDDVSPFHRELADESALEGEASNYAAIMAAHEAESEIHYEVRSASTGELLYTTDNTESAAGTKPERNPKTRTNGRTRKEASCPDKIHQPDKLNQRSQLRMTIS